ncbi:MAG: excinuclease ABC subunit UvrA [Pseudomonadota bacterium]
MTDTIRIRGAREHNLADIDLDVPKNSLVVITGVSGSGKSSLAFDTIYAEGQRRYVESLSAYARQFLEISQKPDVDLIEGLSPAISIEQKTVVKNPRSTVGTVTEIYDYLRVLFARAGTAYSPATGKPITSQTISEMVDRILELPKGARLLLLAPVVRDRKGEYRKELAELRKRGFVRAKIDGTVYRLDDPPKLEKNIRHSISVIVDRLVVEKDMAERLADSLETALGLSGGIIYIEDHDGKAPTLTFSAKFTCPVSGFTIDEIEPRLFSYNSPHGACPTCTGLGIQEVIDPDRVVPDPRKSLSEGAIKPWDSVIAGYYRAILRSLAQHLKISMDTPWEELPAKAQKAILWGTTENVLIKYDGDKFQYQRGNRPFEGVLHNLMRRYKETTSTDSREALARYYTKKPCDACHGQRLREEALAVRIGQRTIADVVALSIDECIAWIDGLKLSKQKAQIAAPLLREVRERLSFLHNVGLNYLTLSRSSATLSGGESQRIRLASQIGSGLTGVLYVLDEPSIGLHQRDNAQLLATLFRLRDLQNTVIVVEHDEAAIAAANHLIDMGPGAGIHGGKVIASGQPKKVFTHPDSLTAQYLSGRRQIALPAQRRTPEKDRQIKITGCRANNLKNVNLSLPLGVFTCVTGVSGSGKSTLVIETLYRALASKLTSTKEDAGTHKQITGIEHIDKLIDINQSPIGRTPRSNPATYTGAFTPIREWFAALPASQARGYGPGRYSFNVKGGRCEACQGDGVKRIEMHFLSDVFVQCDVCRGRRYGRETLEITYRDKSIADVLEMTVDEALALFRPVNAIYNKLRTLQEVGLGYIKVGQAATTLSGGEAQRVKLAKELSRRSTKKTLYILDEPTTGLHFEDIRKLLAMLQQLVDAGNTVVVIEHNMDVIKTADWIIDIGPEGGEKGGKIIAEGPPEDITKVKASHTGRFLTAYVAKPAPKKRRQPSPLTKSPRARKLA